MDNLKLFCLILELTPNLLHYSYSSLGSILSCQRLFYQRNVVAAARRAYMRFEEDIMEIFLYTD